MTISAHDFIQDKSILYVLKNNLLNNKTYSGIYNGPSYEIKTLYDKASGETLVDSSVNAFIVLGRDRNAGQASGNGGKGITGASSIDIIAGHMGPRPIRQINGEPIYSGKDFKNDAARIYVSQMSNIDEYFEIPQIQIPIGNSFTALEQSNNLSAIGIKADAVRLIGRESIKITTFHRGINSNNEKSINGGIDIIAGCNVMNAEANMSLQPIVKGNNLISLLQEIIARIDDVQSTVTNFMNIQKDINDIMSRHTHQSNKAGLATSNKIGEQSSLKNFKLLIDVLPTIIQNHISNIKIDSEYFNPMSAKYINSVWNRVN